MSPPGRPKGEYRRAQPEGTPVSAQTVFVVDDDDAYRDSIVELVASVGLRAECFASAQQFLDAFDPQRGGCLVLDVRMAHMSGIALQARLKEMAATLPIVFVSGHGDIEMAVKAVKDGAVDFVQKPYREQQLLDAINEALRLDAETRRGAAPAPKAQASAIPDARLARLSAREREVLALALQGLPSKEIARRLGLSYRTIEHHRSRLLDKLGAASVTELLRIFPAPGRVEAAPKPPA
ncbi:MAG: response regulator transcription factor [Burkholderiales bacterium]|nr:response regulator transcription factor [Burkholderiales bacterium]